MDDMECVYVSLPSAPASSTDTSMPPTEVKLDGKLELDVQLCALQPSIDPITTYPNITSPKGHVIIFNNRRFHDPDKERHGTDVDKYNLEKLFSKLGYRVQIRQDYTAAQMLHAMKTFSQKPQHEQSDSCVVVVLSHGGDGFVYGTDGLKVQLKEFLGMLDGENCPGMRGKPKLCLMQACRGRMADDGVQPDAEGENDGEQQSKIPITADMLVAYSTAPGYISWRYAQTGSLFIQTICEVFAKYSHQNHVLDLLTRVNNLVSSREVCRGFGRCRRHCGANSQCRGHLQMPEFTSRLRRSWFLFPGLSTPSVPHVLRAQIEANGAMETIAEETLSGDQDESNGPHREAEVTPELPEEEGNIDQSTINQRPRNTHCTEDKSD